MARRGRKLGTTTVDPMRDRKVLYWVARTAIEAGACGQEVTLRDRMDAPGVRTKAPPASAYKMAQEALRKHENIHLGVDSIEKIWKRYKGEYVNDLTYFANKMATQMRRQQGKKVPAEEPFVPRGDQELSDGADRPRIWRDDQN